MHASPSLEQARAYLDVQISRPPKPAAGISSPPEGPYVTISRESGVGATEFATRLAAALNAPPAPDALRWTVFDQHIVEKVLVDEHLSPRLARFLPEDRVPEITGSVGEIVGLHPNLWSLVQKTSRLTRALAQRGHVILVGRGSNFATAGVGGGVHVRLVAPESVRIQNTARVRGASFEEARSIVRKTDSARAHYVRSVFDRDVADVTAYDLVVNSARFSSDRLVALVVALVQQVVRNATAA